MQAGHALAAAAEGVGIHAVSFFMVLLLPGAYVTLNTDNLAVLGPWRALNVRRHAFSRACHIWDLSCMVVKQKPKSFSHNSKPSASSNSEGLLFCRNVGAAQISSHPQWRALCMAICCISAILICAPASDKAARH